MVMLLLHRMKLEVIDGCCGCGVLAVAWTVIAALVVSGAVLETGIVHQCGEPLGTYRDMEDYVLHSPECAHVQIVLSLQTGVAADTCTEWMELDQSVYRHQQ